MFSVFPHICSEICMSRVLGKAIGRDFEPPLAPFVLPKGIKVSDIPVNISCLYPEH